MHELYNSFERQYDVVQDHHTHSIEVTKAFDNVLYWEKHIKYRIHDLPVMGKIQTKKTGVTIETWESICDAVESIIKGGNMACRRRWLAAKTLLSFLDFPSLDMIDQELPPKLKLEEIEWNISTTKDKIQGIIHLTM